MFQQLNSSDKLASVIMPPTALKYEVRVQESGRVEFSVPFTDLIVIKETSCNCRLQR